MADQNIENGRASVRYIGGSSIRVEYPCGCVVKRVHKSDGKAVSWNKTKEYAGSVADGIDEKCPRGCSGS